MNIHQLSVNYIQEQDRILVRINTSSQEELRLWFTRRLTIHLLPNLERVVTRWVASLEAASTASISPSASADPQTQQLLTEFKRDESLQNSDFKTPYQAQVKAFPLGAEPLLVTELNISPLPSGQLQLSFSEKLSAPASALQVKPRGFSVALEQKLVHGLMHLLRQALQVSQWNIPTQSTGSPELHLPGELPPGGDVGSGGRPKYLN